MLRALTAELSDPGRFSRAKAYARDGAVVDIEIQPGEVRVEVLGSRYEPYQTRVWATPAEDRTSPIGLVPERDELGAECTCPDDAPYAFCKHALTALLVLADEVTIDPEVLVDVALGHRCRAPTTGSGRARSPLVAAAGAGGDPRAAPAATTTAGGDARHRRRARRRPRRRALVLRG